MDNDCIKCHFAFEERELFPHLPPEVRARLQGQHDWLKRNGYPASSVMIHGQEETAIFRRWCPAHLADQAEADHANFDAALKRHARRGMLVSPTETIAERSAGMCCTKCRTTHQAVES